MGLLDFGAKMIGGALKIGVGAPLAAAKEVLTGDITEAPGRAVDSVVEGVDDVVESIDKLFGG